MQEKSLFLKYEKLLKKQEMKLVRNQPDKYFDALSAEQIKQKLRELDHTVCDKSTDDLHQVDSTILKCGMTMPQFVDMVIFWVLLPFLTQSSTTQVMKYVPLWSRH